ncbi:MAG: class I SAM-dependent methyltransferase [Ilumatobacteraceae bacterium]
MPANVLPEDRQPEDRRPEHWENVADHLGSAYLRYSFTKGTEQEVDFLVGKLGLEPGMRVLDVGCGPGRHARALAARGIAAHGIDISQTFVDLAADGAPPLATFARVDARELAFDREFDAVICLCQGAFGVMTASGDDHIVFARIAACLRLGGRLALSAFSSYFAVKYHEDATFDAATGISHERTSVKNPDGADADIDLWTGCYTPRELRLLCDLNGLVVDGISSVEPGRYGTDSPSTESPEFLLRATRC